LDCDAAGTGAGALRVFAREQQRPSAAFTKDVRRDGRAMFFTVMLHMATLVAVFIVYWMFWLH
jgi:hypothetical protein